MFLSPYSPQALADLLGGGEGRRREDQGPQRGDAGSLVPAEGAAFIVKCALRDNLARPNAVMDVKLAVNVPDSDLLGFLLQRESAAESLAVELFSYNLDQTGEGAAPEALDRDAIRRRIGDLVDLEALRGQGFAWAAGSLAAILEASRLGYQYIENLKGARELLIREYEETDPGKLPDERFQIRLRYSGELRLAEERRAYDAQIRSFDTELRHLWEVLEAVYRDRKPFFRVSDFRDLAQKEKFLIRRRKEKTGEPLYEDMAKTWDEISFVKPAETGEERGARSYLYEKDRISRTILYLRGRLKDMYGPERPGERRFMEERLDFLEGEFTRFESLVNPYQVQPGLLLEADLTSIKRKRLTLDAVSSALGEFFRGLFDGFQEAASALLGAGGEGEAPPAESPAAHPREGAPSPERAPAEGEAPGTEAPGEKEKEAPRKGRPRKDAAKAPKKAGAPPKAKSPPGAPAKERAPKSAGTEKSPGRRGTRGTK
jgi:hypothetical protein